VKRIPSDINFSADYPCVAIHQEDRTTMLAAEEFCKWLTRRLEADPLHLGKFFFRPSTDRVSPGMSPTEFPSGDVLEEIQRVWRQHRKLADVFVAVDRSESMAHQLDQIQTELGACLQEFVDSDRVGLVSIGDDLQMHVPLGRFGGTRNPILDAIEELDPQGRTAFRDGILASVEAISGVRDSDRIAAVVAITDGDREGDPSQAGLTDLTAALRETDPPIRVFIVESGGTVNAATKIAGIEASQGRVFNVADADKAPLGGASPVAQVCGEVFSYF
jgi:hypothetical protein